MGRRWAPDRRRVLATPCWRCVRALVSRTGHCSRPPGGGPGLYSLPGPPVLSWAVEGGDGQGPNGRFQYSDRARSRPISFSYRAHKNNPMGCAPAARLDRDRRSARVVRRGGALVCTTSRAALGPDRREIDESPPPRAALGAASESNRRVTRMACIWRGTRRAFRSSYPPPAPRRDTFRARSRTRASSSEMSASHP